MPEITPFTNLDFFDIKESLKQYLKTKDQFKDYNFEGSNLSVLLDVLAYNTYHNNFISNMAISESFLDSAQLKNSVVSHAKELNYLPQSRSSARATIDLRINPNDNPSVIVIPRKTKFIARCGNKIFNFYNNESVILSKIRGRYLYKSLEIFEGLYVTETFLVSSTSKFVLSNDNVDVSSIKLKIKDSVNSSTYRDFIRKTSLFGVKSIDPVFYVQSAFDDKYEVTFGSNIFGEQPSIGNIIEIEYRVSNGDEANGVTSISTENISGYPAVVTGIIASTGGSERESIDSIKFFAPKSLQLQERAVTEYDYEVILKNNFPEISSVSAYGGDKANPPQFGRVIISVDLNNHEKITPYDVSKYTSFLKSRSPLAIEPIVNSADYMYIAVNSKIKYNVNKTVFNIVDIKEQVKTAILTHSTKFLNSFGSNLFYSKLVQDIDNSDVSIKSNETELTCYYKFSPEIDTNSTYYFNYDNKLKSVISSAFIFNNIQSFITDNNGSLNIATINELGAISNIKLNIGTVNYVTGEIRISNLSVNGYDKEIKMYGVTVDKDIKTPIGKIMYIKVEDIITSVIG